MQTGYVKEASINKELEPSKNLAKRFNKQTKFRPAIKSRKESSNHSLSTIYGKQKLHI
jgi:hypothetical protein